MEQIYRRNLKRNRIGCMWMFISIFGSNQKRLLMDNKRGSKRLAVNEKKQLTCSCESSQESVEKLIEEEEILGKKDIDVSIGGDEHVETDESEEDFSEIIKRLIAQKEEEIQTCKDLLEAFHVLSSEEEPIPNKILHEDAQSLGDSKKPDVVSKQEGEVIPQRKSKFFSRKWKSQEKRNRSQVAKTIVVLKPGPNSLDLDQVSSPGPHSSGNKSKNGRTFSRFLIGLLKKLFTCVVELLVQPHLDHPLQTLSYWQPTSQPGNNQTQCSETKPNIRTQVRKFQI